MKNIFVDIDGVLRDLSLAVFGISSPEWDYRVNGKNLVDLINEDLTILETAPPTKYLELIKSLPEIHIISCQPEHWREYTNRWIGQHFKIERTYWVYTTNHDEKLDIIDEYDGILIEDYPFFSPERYLKDIILISHKYNDCVKCNRRVKTVEDLRQFIFD